MVKGTSDEAKKFGDQVRDRFIEFVDERGIREVSDKTGCNEQVFRNPRNGTRPAIDTLCQVKIGYGDEFDINYLFTGEKAKAPESSESETSLLREKIEALTAKLAENNSLIKELRADKFLLQEVIMKKLVTN